MRRLGRPLVLAGFAVLFLTGAAVAFLGGRSSEKARFFDAAAEVCVESRARVQSASDALLGPSPSRDEVVAFLGGAFTDELYARVAQLRALDVPDGEVGAFTALLDEYTEVVAVVEADPATAAAGADPFAAVEARFDAYGLEECGSAPPG